MKKPNKKELIAAYKERKVKGGVYAIKNTVTGKVLLLCATDIQGCKNRFDFSQNTGGCVNMKLTEDWNKYGGKSFVFELLEEVEMSPTQTQKEFSEDIKLLYEIWLEKLNSVELY